MKKIVIFILGIITGITLLGIILFSISKSSSLPDSSPTSSNNGIIIFSEVGECISNKQFRVFQVLEQGVALATELSDIIGGTEFYSGTTVLFLTEGKYFYDDEIIRVPKGKCVRQVGVYQYPTQGGSEKTVPIVQIMDK